MRKRKSKIAVRPPNRHDADVETRIFGLGCSGGTGHYGMPSLPAIAAHRRSLPLLPAVAACHCCPPSQPAATVCLCPMAVRVRQWRESCRNFSPLWVALPSIPFCSGHMAHPSMVGFSILPFLRLKAFTAGKH